MDVDSAMATDNDRDPLEQETTVNGEDQPTESESSLHAQQQQSDGNNSVSNSNSGGGALLAGPRCAPNYSVVNAVIEKKEDGPGPRCGHTLTAVPAVGEEGSSGYLGPRLILFGGATALEGNSASGTPSSAGSAGIRMLFQPRNY